MENQIKLWEERVFDSIKDISDNESQKRSWLGHDPNVVRSFDEDLCMLFDSNDFESYIEYYKETTGEDKLYHLFLELNQMLKHYQSPGSDRLVLKDPSWIIITDKAKEIVPLLNFTEN